MKKELTTIAREWIKESHKIVAFTGAGISTDSGIPDLDSIDQILQREKFEGGVFRMLDPNFAVENPDLFYRLYEETFRKINARPNIAHRILKKYEDEESLVGVVTMNIDYLHQLAGSKNVAELWGDMRKNSCTTCHKSFEWPVDRAPLRTCDVCGGVILPNFVINRLATCASQIRAGNRLLKMADLLLIIGTKRSPESFNTDVKKIIINKRVTSQKKNNNIYLQGDAGDVLSDFGSIS